MMKKIFDTNIIINNILKIVFLMLLFFCVDVKAADNLKTELTNDADTKTDKCPLVLSVQDNLKGQKDMDFSTLDCIYYQMDANGNYVLDENGEKILRKEDEEVNFSCLQTFLDKYTNSEFAEAANNNTDDGFRKIKYCPIYCVEENKYLFPGYASTINSGGHFTWTIGKNDDKNIIDGLTVRLHGTKVCRTHVDLDSWTKDYSDIMQKIEDLISVKDPISNGSEDCTPNPDNGTDALTSCGYDPNPYKTFYYAMKVSDYDTFKNYSEMKQLAGENPFYSATGIVTGRGSQEGVLQTLSDVDSNRYFFSSVPYKIADSSLDGIIKIINRGAATDVPTTFYRSHEEMMNALVGGNNSIATITIKFDIWERHCCTWEKDTNNIPLFYAINIPGWNIDDGIPKSVTYGYKNSGNSKVGCKLIDSGRDVSTEGLNTKNGTSCCGTVQSRPTNCSCIDYPSIIKKATCESRGGTWSCSGTDYYCNSGEGTNTYNLYQRYVVKCGTDGTGDVQEIASEGNDDGCTYSSIPSCQDGYSYSPNTGKCYYADVEQIEIRLEKLLGLIHDLKQCHDILQDYDYYLDTEMEVEYNKTSDSKNNLYFPHNDTVTQTELNKVTENSPANDNENLIGEYDSAIVKPSNKSEYVRYVNFFGKRYKFSRDGIPLVGCTLSGPQKTCTATNNTSLNDYWYDWYGRTYVAMYEYRLDGDFYKWVKLPSGESISTMPTGDYLKYGRFIDIGYANYPVHYSTPGGEYEGLNIKITNIGYKNYLYNTYQTTIRDYNNNLTDKDFVSTEGQNQLLHDCYYEVTEGEPYCPTKGCKEDKYELGSVRIIYRPISLENPFPAMDGQGRDTGSNWCTLKDDGSADCSNQNDNVEKYILNNRNTEGSSVYQKDPMYQITLTPTLIRAIQNYNNITNYDDFNMICSGVAGKEGTECRSHFLVGGLEGSGLPTLSTLNTDPNVISGCGLDYDWNNCDTKDKNER